jgi:hypothetical protein
VSCLLEFLLRLIPTRIILSAPVFRFRERFPMVALKQRGALWKCAAVFGLPLAPAVLISWTISELVSADTWSRLNGWLFDMYGSVGLYGVPYAFAWSWGTVFLVIGGGPYCILVLVVQALARGTRSLGGRGGWQAAARMCGHLLAALFLSFPIALLMLRVGLPLVPVTWMGGADRVSGRDSSMAARVAATASLVVVYGVPWSVCAIVIFWLCGRYRAVVGAGQACVTQGGGDSNSCR